MSNNKNGYKPLPTGPTQRSTDHKSPRRTKSEEENVDFTQSASLIDAYYHKTEQKNFDAEKFKLRPGEELDQDHVNLLLATDHGAVDQEKFDQKYGCRHVDLTLGSKIHYHYSKMARQSRSQWFDFARSRIPITKWLPAYEWRKDALIDIIGGCMLSVMCVPQGLAYGDLVGVPPINGVITGIFGPIIYAMMGTSKHASPGAFAIISLLIGGAVENYAGGGGETNNSTVEGDLDVICCEADRKKASPEDALEIACSLTLLIGIWQIIFGILNAGLLAVWLSDHLVKGLTSGAAVQVLTSQLHSMTGVHGVPTVTPVFSMIEYYICFFRQIHTINYATTTISAICVFLLLLSSYFIDPILKKWTNIKFPMEFILASDDVVLSILIVALSQNTQFQIDVTKVGEVSSGIGLPRMPNVKTWRKEMISTAITAAVISFVIHIALAKLVSKQLKYEIDANQEWFALGLMHTFSSFFGCFAGGSSLGRTTLQMKLGVKSQLSTIICCVILVGFVFGAARFLFYLPKAVLASIVVVAMKDLYIQIFSALKTYRESLSDFFIFVITFATVITVDLNTGLIVGVAFALLTVIFRTQWADTTVLGRIPGTAYYKGLGHYDSAQTIPGIKIFRFDAPLYFANTEMFTQRLHRACGFHPFAVESKMEAQRCKLNKRKGKQTDVKNKTVEDDIKLKVQGQNVTVATKADSADTEQLTHVILDCSSMSFIDTMGKDALAQAVESLEPMHIKVLFANCKIAVRQMFLTSDFYTRLPNMKTRMFVSVNDAVQSAEADQRSNKPRVEIKKPDSPRAKTPKPTSKPISPNAKEENTQSLGISLKTATQRGNDDEKQPLLLRTTSHNRDVRRTPVGNGKDINGNDKKSGHPSAKKEAS